ncbi:MAG TPA: TRAP transporter TatT component family protein [Pyrinomonadaceae bacterium]|nr:TRAP transporter TatT component family protein [Pyrinomonadaceae bacterium]
MATLDNSTICDLSKRDILSKLAVLGASLVFAAGLSACSKSAEQAVSAPSSGRSPAETITQADELYAQRADVMKVRQGLIALRQATAEHATNYELAWRVAQYNYYLGSHTTDETEQEKAFHDGTEAGKLAVKLNNDRPEGHFWLGANYGGNAEISTLAGLAEIEDIKREMEAVLKIDESFQSGSAYMALGQVYLKAPRILGGDVSKAIEYLEKGLKFGPNNALLRLRLAEAYAEAKRIPDAQRELKTLFESQPSPGFEPEHSDAVREGRELEAKLKS